MENCNKDCLNCIYPDCILDKKQSLKGDRRNEYHEWYMKNKEKRSAYMKQYYRENKEQINKRQREYYLKNSERITERAREYYYRKKKEILNANE